MALQASYFVRLEQTFVFQTSRTPCPARRK